MTDEGMFVGTTAIRESNHDYYKIITDSDTEEPAPESASSPIKIISLVLF